MLFYFIKSKGFGSFDTTFELESKSKLKSKLAPYKSQGFGFVAFLLTRLFAVLRSSKYAQFESSSTMVLPALMSETTSGKKEEKLRT